MSGPPDRTTRRAQLPALLRRIGGMLLPRTAIAVGIGTTIAMNFSGGLWDGGTGGAVVAVLYPTALVLSLETLIWMIRRFGKTMRPFAENWELWTAIGTLAGLAAVTGIISYLHALTVLQRTGSGHLGWTAVHLGPLVPDQMILTGTLALMAAARRTALSPARPDRATGQRTAKADQPDQPARRAGQTRPASPRTTAAARRAAEKARIVNLVRQLGAVPGERALAAEYCGGSRRLARDVLADLATATNGSTRKD